MGDGVRGQEKTRQAGRAAGGSSHPGGGVKPLNSSTQAPALLSLSASLKAN